MSAACSRAMWSSSEVRRLRVELSTGGARCQTPFSVKAQPCQVRTNPSTVGATPRSAVRDVLWTTRHEHVTRTRDLYLTPISAGEAR